MSDHQVLLGIGEAAHVRRPTRSEQQRHQLAPEELVIEWRHTDRDPDVVPARGAVLTPRGYGLTPPPSGGAS